MQPESAKLLFDAAEAGKAVAQFVMGRTLEEYERDLLFRSAVERQLFILGEAMSQLRQWDQDTFDLIPDAKRIVSFRNLLAHGYGQVDHARVWAIVETDLPSTLNEILNLLT